MRLSSAVSTGKGITFGSVCSTGLTDLISCDVLSVDVLERCHPDGAAFSASCWLGSGMSGSISGRDMLEGVRLELTVRQFSFEAVWLERLPAGAWRPDVEGWGIL